MYSINAQMLIFIISRDAPETPSDPASDLIGFLTWLRPDNTISCRVIVPDIKL